MPTASAHRLPRSLPREEPYPASPLHVYVSQPTTSDDRYAIDLVEKAAAVAWPGFTVKILPVTLLVKPITSPVLSAPGTLLQGLQSIRSYCADIQDTARTANLSGHGR